MLPICGGGGGGGASWRWNAGRNGGASWRWNAGRNALRQGCIHSTGNSLRRLMLVICADHQHEEEEEEEATTSTSNLAMRMNPIAGTLKTPDLGPRPQSSGVRFKSPRNPGPGPRNHAHAPRTSLCEPAAG